MATKDITDLQVCLAYIKADELSDEICKEDPMKFWMPEELVHPYHLLMESGQVNPVKSATERWREHQVVVISTTE